MAVSSNYQILTGKTIYIAIIRFDATTGFVNISKLSSASSVYFLHDVHAHLQPVVVVVSVLFTPCFLLSPLSPVLPPSLH